MTGILTEQKLISDCRYRVIESSSLVPVLFREVFSHPYISFFHLLVNGFSVIYIWTPRLITLPHSRCACGVTMKSDQNEMKASKLNRNGLDRSFEMKTSVIRTTVRMGYPDKHGEMRRRMRFQHLLRSTFALESQPEGGGDVRGQVEPFPH